MCPILLWNVVACSRNRRGKTQEEDKSKDIGSSRETLSRYGWGQLPLKKTKELAEVARTLTGLKQALVFQLDRLLGRLFELLIRLCEHGGRPCWICLQALGRDCSGLGGPESHDVDSNQKGVMNPLCNFTLRPAACDLSCSRPKAQILGMLELRGLYSVFVLVINYTCQSAN